MPTGENAEWRLATLLYLTDHLKILQHDKLQPQRVNTLNVLANHTIWYSKPTSTSKVWQTKHSSLVSRKTTFTYLHDTGKVQTTQMIKIFKMSQVRSVLAHSLGTIERSARDAFTWERALTTQVRSVMAHSLGTIERSTIDAFTWEKAPSLQL